MKTIKNSVKNIRGSLTRGYLNTMAKLRELNGATTTVEIIVLILIVVVILVVVFFPQMKSLIMKYMQAAESKTDTLINFVG
ncbi:MAG: hypothetical protein RR508_08395 [Oscillospiraceae bacterium]